MRLSALRQSHSQRGMSFWGTLIVLAALILLGTVGLKSMPAYLEFNAIRTAVKKIGKEDLASMTKKDIAQAFDKQASVDNIDSISGADLQFDGSVITAEYQKVIPLFGNISILLDFNVTSAK
jgi:hypothetical protein